LTCIRTVAFAVNKSLSTNANDLASRKARRYRRSFRAVYHRTYEKIPRTRLRVISRSEGLMTHAQRTASSGSYCHTFEILEKERKEKGGERKREKKPDTNLRLLPKVHGYQRLSPIISGAASFPTKAGSLPSGAELLLAKSYKTWKNSDGWIIAFATYCRHCCQE
jgi:hypothetical protein